MSLFGFQPSPLFQKIESKLIEDLKKRYAGKVSRTPRGREGSGDTVVEGG